MTTYQHPTELRRSIDALERDLLHPDGPAISTVRNYNFAILPYPPDQELTLRAAIHDLSEKLRDHGWNTGTVPLHAVFLRRLRAQGDDFVEGMVRREKQLATSNDPMRGLRSLKERVVSLLEGPDGLAADVIREIHRILDKSEDPTRTVVFLGRAGALYPFFRTSALLKHVAGHTRNAPVVLLYPGAVVDDTGLSFMGVLPADRDYRPRIYR